jgi:hypothetical protein
VASGLVRGKVVKFRCKRCKEPIEVDGTALSVEGGEAALASPSLAPPLPGDPTTDPITFFGVSSRPSQVDFGGSMRLSISDGWEGALPPAEPAAPRAPTVVLTDRVLRPPPATITPSGAVALSVPPSSRRSAPPPLPLPAVQAAPPYPSSMRETAPLPGHGAPAWMGPPRPAAEQSLYNSPTAPPTVIHQSTPPRAVSTGRPTAAQWAGQHQRAVMALLVAAAALGVTIVVWRAPTGGNASSTLSAEPRATAAQTAHDEPRPVEPPVVAPAPPAEPSAALALSEPTNATPRAASSRSGRSGRGRSSAARAARAAAAEATDGELSGNAASAAQAMAEVLKERELDPSVARAALDDAAHEAAGCRTDDTSAHFARFSITFAPTGRVSAVDIEGGPLAGTSVGACMIDAFKAAQVPAFSGPPVIVHKNVSF